MTNSQFLKLLPEFKKRFFHNYGKNKIAYGRQRKDSEGRVSYDRTNTGTITDALLLKHFSQEPEMGRFYSYGSLAVLGEWDVVKWICIDADSAQQISDANNKIIPALISYGITPIIEPSRDGRMHIWFLTNLSLDTAQRFLLQIFAELVINYREWEIYPLFERRKAIIRIPGGYHFKSGKANGVLVDSVEVTKPAAILEVFCSAQIYGEEFIKPLLRSVEMPRPSGPQKEKVRTKFVYLSRNLPDPMPDMPRMIQVITKECQAYRKLIFDVVNNDLIEERGVFHHNSGLCLSALAQTHEFVVKDGKGEEWWDSLRDKYRSRDDKEHNWDQKPGMKVWNCSTMENNFGFCQGCPFKDQIENPRQLFFGKQISKIKVDDVF